MVKRLPSDLCTDVGRSGTRGCFYRYVWWRASRKTDFRSRNLRPRDGDAASTTSATSRYRGRSSIRRTVTKLCRSPEKAAWDFAGKDLDFLSNVMVGILVFLFYASLSWSCDAWRNVVSGVTSFEMSRKWFALFKTLEWLGILHISCFWLIRVTFALTIHFMPMVVPEVLEAPELPRAYFFVFCLLRQAQDTCCIHTGYMDKCNS